VRRYAIELFGAIAATAEADVLAIGAAENCALPPGVGRVAATSPLPTNAAWMLTALPRAVRRARVDLFHAPAYTAPLVGVHPLVLTIHDVSYARHPEWYPYRRDPLRRAFYRASAGAADAIVTDSEFSRREIVEAYGTDPARVTVVPLAAASHFRPGDAGALPAGLDPGFVLHVGDMHPRRNLQVLARAMAHVNGARTRPVRLVLAGADRGEADALGRMAGAAIVFLPAPTDAELLALYRAAAVLAYPSRYEGFGLPLVEAMSCGTPVIAARAGSLPEVMGNAGPLVDPDDVEGFAAAIASIVDDPAARADARTRSLVRAAVFSWDRTARETLAVYRTLT
jgi:glycosyltransferase involved in cell wall biosynthesis